MSDDLISRQAAIDSLIDDLYDLLESDMVNNDFIREGLMKVPSVQPKTGHWRDTITAGINETVCSVCLYSGFHHFNYCPNCGTKMKGEAE